MRSGSQPCICFELKSMYLKLQRPVLWMKEFVSLVLKACIHLNIPVMWKTVRQRLKGQEAVSRETSYCWTIATNITPYVLNIPNIIALMKQQANAMTHAHPVSGVRCRVIRVLYVADVMMMRRNQCSELLSWEKMLKVSTGEQVMRLFCFVQQNWMIKVEKFCDSKRRFVSYIWSENKLKRVVVKHRQNDSPWCESFFFFSFFLIHTLAWWVVQPFFSRKVCQMWL